MKNNKFYSRLATLGPLGYLPAPGTFGSIPGLLFMWGFNNIFLNLSQSFFLLVVTTIFGYLIINSALKYFYSSDPSQIVFDEFVGCIYTFFMIPVSYKSFILGFFLFRFFDITKILGIHKVEKYPGTFGILADDIAAGLISNAILNLLIYFSWI